MIAGMTFIVTTAMIVKQGRIAQLYYIVSFFEIVSVVRLFYQDMSLSPNKITGAKAGGPRQLAIQTRWAARFAQFRR